MMHDDRSHQPSPWHAGEQRLQALHGVADHMGQIGRKVVRPFMPDQHREFFAQLPFMIAGAVDAHGAPWATLLEGAPGFVSSPDVTTLDVRALPAAGDPVRDAIAPGEAIGLLGIELHTRRRNRANGRIARHDADGFVVTVEQSFGNCPRYIQTRDWSFAGTPGQGGSAVEDAPGLDAAARATIVAADTCFVASYADDGGPSGRAVDVSHRGGRAGFVRVDGDVLTIPDFAGNLFFNTLGNLLVNPRAGLLFVDFERGDLLQLSGRTEIVFDGPELTAFDGAERLWRFTIERAIRRPSALALRWRFGEYSPHLAGTGSWSGETKA